MSAESVMISVTIDGGVISSIFLRSSACETNHLFVNIDKNTYAGNLVATAANRLGSIDYNGSICLAEKTAGGKHFPYLSTITESEITCFSDEAWPSLRDTTWKGQV